MKKLFASMTIIIVLLAAGCGNSNKKASTEKGAEQTTSKATTQEKVSANNQIAEETGEVVARVNGRPIYKADLLRRTLDEAIADEVLYQEGLRLGKDKKFQRKINDYRKRLVVNSFRKEILDKGKDTLDKTVTPEEIDKYYNDNIDKYIHLVLQRISVRSKKAAEDIRARLLKGEDIDSIKSRYKDSKEGLTINTTRSTNRFNSYFPVKDVGEVSPVINRDNRYQVLKIVSINTIPLGMEQNAIRYSILALRRGQLVRDYADKIKKEHNFKIEILEK